MSTDQGVVLTSYNAAQLARGMAVRTSNTFTLRDIRDVLDQAVVAVTGLRELQDALGHTSQAALGLDAYQANQVAFLNTVTIDYASDGLRAVQRAVHKAMASAPATEATESSRPQELRKVRRAVEAITAASADASVRNLELSREHYADLTRYTSDIAAGLSAAVANFTVWLEGAFEAYATRTFQWRLSAIRTTLVEVIRQLDHAARKLHAFGVKLEGKAAA